MRGINAKPKASSKKDKGKVSLDNNFQININDLSFKDQEVYTFLSDKEDKEDWTKKAIVIGSIGLKNMLVGYNVDYVDKKFSEFMRHADEKFKSESQEIVKKIDEVFSLDNKNSLASRLYSKIDETFDEDNKNSPMGKLVSQLENYFDDKKGIVRKIISENFDATNKKSPMGQFIERLNHYFDEKNGILKRILDGTFDTNNSDTSLGKLMNKFDFYFNERTGVIKKQIDSTFDINKKNSVMGRFVELLEENFDIDKGKIRKLLDSDLQNSPANQMKEELLKHLFEIEKLLNIKKGQEQIIEKTPIKGGRFEDEISEQLSSITQPFGDIFEYKGNTTGRGGKKGDFIILIEGDESKKIVLEAKDALGKSKNEIEEDVEDSIKNRSAKFGIFLFKSEEQIPSAFRPLKITKKSIITSYDNNGLYFAYRLAKLFIENESKQNQDNVPIDKIEIEIQDIQKQCKLIDSLITKTTQITKFSSHIHDSLTELHNKIEISLGKIEEYIKNK